MADNGEFHNVYMDCLVGDCLLGFLGPKNVEPKFEFVTKCAAGCQACVADTCKLGISGNDVANLHFPFIAGVCNEAVDMFELADDRLWEWDLDFVRPEHGCHVTCDHGIDAMVEVFRKFCFILFCFALAADASSDLVESLLDCSAESILEAEKSVLPCRLARDASASVPCKVAASKMEQLSFLIHSSSICWSTIRLSGGSV